MFAVGLPNGNKPAFAISANVEAMGNRLRELRQRPRPGKPKGLTLEEVGEKSGMSHVQVSRLETGNRQLKSHQLEALARALDVSTADILDDRPRVAVVGFVGAGAVITHFDEAAGGVDCPRGLDPVSTHALRVSVPLDPLIGRNWLLFYTERPEFDPAHALGKLCAVELASGARMLAQVRPSASGMGFTLIPYGAPIVDDAMIRAAWPITVIETAAVAGIIEEPIAPRRRMSRIVRAAASREHN